MNIKTIKYSYKYQSPKGLNESIVHTISQRKNEPAWMRDFRLKAFQIFKKKKLPKWGPDLTKLDLHSLTYYLSPLEEKTHSWQDVPQSIKKTYDQLGIPQAEKQYLGGVTAQLESDVIYEGVKKELTDKGVIFLETNEALKLYPRLFRKYFAKLVSPEDNKFSALNSAFWSGGSFIYIPKGVKVEMPLQAFFLINSNKVGQFERTLIIADDDSFVHYIEGCTAPQYSQSSLHAAVVEVFVGKNARVRYTTVQNWSHNVYNLTTKRSYVAENGIMEWVDVNLGSQITMKYPACILAGKKSRGEMLSLSYAGHGQVQDSGAKMIHLAPETSSRIIAKSISQDKGRCNYRGLVSVNSQAKNSQVFVNCDALLLDEKAVSATYPTMKIDQKQTKVQHEATVQKIDAEKLFYFASRGINQEQAQSLLVNGFIEPIVKEIPFEYAIEMNRLLNLEMKNKLG